MIYVSPDVYFSMWSLDYGMKIILNRAYKTTVKRNDETDCAAYKRGGEYFYKQLIQLIQSSNKTYKTQNTDHLEMNLSGSRYIQIY